MNKQSQFFKKPFVISTESGGLFRVEAFLKHVKSLPNTSSAMQRLCRQSVKDDQNYAQGKDDYSNSVNEIFNTLDVFIREYKKKRNVEEIDFDLLDSKHASLYLLWPIRNLIHTGGFIDKKCKDDYEKIYSKIKINKVIPSLDLLPEYLEENHQLSIIFVQNDYVHIRECLFEYIKPKISIDDYDTLNSLASHLHENFEVGKLRLEFGNYTLEDVDNQEIYEAGLRIDDERRIGWPAGNITYDAERKRIQLSNGKSFSATFIEKSRKIKIGRNERCPCGSQKKYKKCCGDPLKKQ